MDEKHKQIESLQKQSSILIKEASHFKDNFFDKMEVQMIKLGLIDSTQYSYSIDDEKKTITAKIEEECDHGSKIAELLGNILGKKS